MLPSLLARELHTFDGAQGTDLALLLRRLRARLKVPEGHLICAGTSATLGGASDSEPLREYARQIFSVSFDADAVVTESRQTVGAFLEDAMVEYMFAYRPEWVEALEPSQYAAPAEAVRAWFALFFQGEPAPADVEDASWRLHLGRLLKQHQLFVNLLKLLKGGVVDYSEVVDTFARHMPSANRAQVGQVMDALLVLVAWSRREGKQPLVTMRLQLWVRELRRMVGKLSVDHPMVVGHVDPHAPPWWCDAPRAAIVCGRWQHLRPDQDDRPRGMDAQDGREHAAPGVFDTGHPAGL